MGMVRLAMVGRAFLQLLASDSGPSSLMPHFSRPPSLLGLLPCLACPCRPGPKTFLSTRLIGQQRACRQEVEMIPARGVRVLEWDTRPTWESVVKERSSAPSDPIY